jgi:sodium/proline symporter
VDGAVGANTQVYVAFSLYFLIIVLIGILVARFSSAGIGEYFLAKRKMHPAVVALSAVTSGRSSWLILGVTGMAFARGISAVWAVVGYIVVELFLFLFVGKRLRRYTEISDDITIPDFLESRFKDRSHLLRVLSAIIIIVFMVAYVAAQFNAGGKAFCASFGMTPFQGVLITATIVLLYTILGGFMAVALTDFVQGIFMIVALVVVPAVAILDQGGLGTVLSNLSVQDAALIDPVSLGAGALIGFLGIGFGSPGNPHILVRYMAIRDARQLRASAWIGTIWNVVMAWGAVFIGLVGRAIYRSQEALPQADTESLFPCLAARYLHPFVFGLVLASVFAAIMSTVDSQLLVAASAVVRDLFQKIARRGAELSQRGLVTASRIVVIALGVVALVLGAVAKKLVFWLVLFAWAGLGASLGPPVILSLFWKRTTKWGVVTGLISGTVLTIVWNQTPALKSRMYELVPAFLVSAALTILVSLFTRPPAEAEDELRGISEKYKL